MLVFLIFAFKQDVLNGWKRLLGIAVVEGVSAYYISNNTNTNTKAQSQSRSQHDKDKDDEDEIEKKVAVGMIEISS